MLTFKDVIYNRGDEITVVTDEWETKGTLVGVSTLEIEGAQMVINGFPTRMKVPAVILKKETSVYAVPISPDTIIYR